MNRGFRSRYISRYEKLNLGFLTFVVASIVAMVFFSAVFAARAPAMGNSADRAWQLSQLVEGVSTAFNPSHGSLSYVQAGHCVSKQVGRRDAVCQGCPRCVSRSPEARFRVVARAVRVSQPAVLSALLVIQLFGLVIPPPFPLKSTKRSAAAIFGRSAPSLRFMVRFGIFCCRQDFLLCFTR